MRFNLVGYGARHRGALARGLGLRAAARLARTPFTGPGGPSVRRQLGVRLGEPRGRLLPNKRRQVGDGAIADHCAKRAPVNEQPPSIFIIAAACRFSGVLLGCCSAYGNVASRHETDAGACDDNSACAALGLFGSCCGSAANDGSGLHFLECCLDPANKVRYLFCLFD